ncbi:MAG: ATP-dependent helicase Lhr and Lhr-like helicase [Pseudomonadota bacterium]|nr:ATP-dependent helicase Lhr and Lhr-like helicase [Pseudomonadota bacterium]
MNTTTSAVTSAYSLLSEPICRYIWDKRWDTLRPIQSAAIIKIITTDNNYILASRTASGKTEAAFLPILTKVDFSEDGVRVLYISPLIALINDQFSRIEELCKYLDVNVTKWHGEANITSKKLLIKQPKGIVLITPESLEAMLVNKLYQVKHLFFNLEYIVIDEIHSFVGTDRGIQLQSIISRIQNVNKKNIKIIGLSATLGDYECAKKFTGNKDNTRVLLDKTAKEINAKFYRFTDNQEYAQNGVESRTLQETGGLSPKLFKELYVATKDKKALIFPNSRAHAEEIAVKLRKISDKCSGHSNYFTHHSSLNKDIRQYVENFAKSNIRQNFCITCTSTLELGIDIGSVDAVFQINSTNSIASLIQRVGRSGRQDGIPSNLYLYATNFWQLLQSLACWLLFKEGFIEPPMLPTGNRKPYDILLHQALSITKSHSGIKLVHLLQQLKANHAFEDIDEKVIYEIIEHLIHNDLLEKIQDEVIIGLNGEKIVNNMDFYSVFQLEDDYKVSHGGNVIGQIPRTIQITDGENIFLAAKIWKIKSIDDKAKRIEVIRALDGKPPVFVGKGSAIVHPQIRRKMLEILFTQEEYDFLNPVCLDEIKVMRKKFSIFKIKDFDIYRPILINKIMDKTNSENRSVENTGIENTGIENTSVKNTSVKNVSVGNTRVDFYTFAGTLENNTLHLLFELCGYSCSLDESMSCLSLQANGAAVMDEILEEWHKMSELLPQIDLHLAELLLKRPTILNFSKYAKHLPSKYQVQLLKNKMFDFESVSGILNKWKLVSNCYIYA